MISDQVCLRGEDPPEFIIDPRLRRLRGGRFRQLLEELRLLYWRFRLGRLRD